VAAAKGEAAVSLFASGSEVSIAIEAQKLLAERGIEARVVSVPCFGKFFEQDNEYREATIGFAPIKVGIEAAVRQGWDAIIGADGIFVGMSGFGASGPYEKLYEHFGITADAVVRGVVQAGAGRATERVKRRV
jgi:transketolase